MNDLGSKTRGWFLLAQSPFESMGSHFRGETAKLYMNDALIAVLVFVGVAIAAGVLYWFFTGAERVRQPNNNPKALFRDLCRAHGIGFREQRLLAQLARHHKLEHPARLFLESARFERTGLSPALQRSVEAISALRAMLFVEPAGAAARSKLVGFAAGVDLPAEASTATR